MAAYDYVRRAYSVHPKVGQRVRHTEINRFGIVARERPSLGHYVMVRFDGERHPSPCHPRALEFDADDRQLLPMWAVYAHPIDYPEHFVARRWVSLPAPKPTHAVRKAETLEELRDLICAEQMVRLELLPIDDPKILEVWLV